MTIRPASRNNTLAIVDPVTLWPIMWWKPVPLTSNSIRSGFPAAPGLNFEPFFPSTSAYTGSSFIRAVSSF
jgi:hypothetical protein